VLGDVGSSQQQSRAARSGGPLSSEARVTWAVLADADDLPDPLSTEAERGARIVSADRYTPEKLRDLRAAGVAVVVLTPESYAALQQRRAWSKRVVRNLRRGPARRAAIRRDATGRRLMMIRPVANGARERNLTAALHAEIAEAIDADEQAATDAPPGSQRVTRICQTLMSLEQAGRALAHAYDRC
jgi:hypothetical protein